MGLTPRPAAGIDDLNETITDVNEKIDKALENANNTRQEIVLLIFFVFLLVVCCAMYVFAVPVSRSPPPPKAAPRRLLLLRCAVASSPLHAACRPQLTEATHVYVAGA